MSNRRKQLLIETWLDPDPDDFITMHDLYVSALEAMEYIEELEIENEAMVDALKPREKVNPECTKWAIRDT